MTARLLADPALDAVCEHVEAYYSAKFARHGASPLGVDWSCMATQWLRFVQLLKVCSFEAPFSLNDLGCGYGALAAFLADRYPDGGIDYLGIDMSPAMVRSARRLHRGKATTHFAIGRSGSRIADYTVASGIMNVMLGSPVSLWESFVRAILLDMSHMSRRGFSVNFLRRPTPGAPPDALYCTEPATWSRFCREELGCTVELLDDYGLPEFTLLVRAPVHD